MALMLAAAAVAGCCMMKVNINFYDILFLYRHNYTLNNSYMKNKFCLMLRLLHYYEALTSWLLCCALRKA